MCLVRVFDYKRYVVFLFFNITYSFLLGNVLEFTTREHCEAKKLLKRLAFVVKSETTKSFTIKGGILGIFLLPKKLLSIGQYAFGAVKGLTSFSTIFS